MILGVAASAVACNQQTPTTVSNTASAPSIAYINNDTLSMHYKYAEDRNKEFRAQYEKAGKDLQVRIQKLQNEIVNFQKRAQAGLMSQNQIQKKQQELAKKEQELAIMKQSQEQGLMAENADILMEVKNRVKAHVDSVSEADNYSLVLGYDEATSTLIWSMPQVKDITWEVLEGLNAEYEKEAASKETEEKK
ncbi:hypothetical protein GCM10023331_15340 [Algivirga pacifica]|uniref:Outer membrane chaperone Skp n=2 Tax=Algivirga pacifica TaxID=1162670 RepID=A0ABP9D5P4_9BACT